MSARTFRRRPFRPALEALEARALLSAPFSFTTFNPGTAPFGNFTVHLNDSGVAAGSYSVEFTPPDPSGVNPPAHDEYKSRGYIRDARGNLTTFDGPGATGTYITALNDAGQVAGTYYDGKGNHGYIRDAQGTLTTFDPPGSINTYLTALNDAGVVAGSYAVPGGVSHGFIRDPQGNIITVDAPGATSTYLDALNNVGVVAGSYAVPGGVSHGFIRDPQGNITTVDPLGSLSTEVEALNDAGVVAGYYNDGNGYHGFIRDAQGTLTTFDPPGSINTYLTALNDAGVVAGYYNDGNGYHGFIRDAQGNITTVGPPGIGSSWVFIFALNGAGQVAGAYGGSRFVGFIGTPAPQQPATTTALTSDHPGGSSVYGQSVTFTAAVGSTPGTPTGAVQFQIDGADFGAAVPLTNGVAQVSTATLSAGRHNVTASYTSDSSSFLDSATAAPLVQTVFPVVLKVTAADATRAYGSPNPTFTGTIAGVQNNDNISALYATAATPASAVGAYAITPTLNDPDGRLGNYSVTVQNGTLTITPAPLTVTANPQTKVYGSPDPALTYAVSGFQLSDTAATVLSGGLTRAAGEGVGSYAIGQGTLAANSDYTLTFTGNSLTITPAPLAVTAASQSKVYGQDNPALTYTVSGLVNGDPAASFTGALATTATSGSSVGDYAITQGTLAATGNYTIDTFIGSTLTVNPAATTTALTASAATARFGVDTVTFTAGVTVNAPGSGTATGSVDFYDTTTGTDLGTAPLVNGTAALSTGALAVGNHALTATYGGDGNFRGSASAAVTVTEQVFARDTSGGFDPTTATWYLRNENSAGAPDIGPFQYGGPGWTPVAGDWNGDGTTTIGVVDPATMTWYLRNENSAGTPDVAAPFQYGLPGWVPVVGDWTGSGHTGIGAFDPATGTWYLRNEASPGAPDAGVFAYGAPGWVPVVGDWDGDGTFTVGVVNPSGPGGTLQWCLRNRNTAGAPDIGPFAYGPSGWQPVAGDWAGQGKTTIGVVAPASNTWFLRNSNTPGSPDLTPFAYGAPGWVPVSGNWSRPAAATAATTASQGMSSNLVADLLATGLRRTRALDQVFSGGSL